MPITKVLDLVHLPFTGVQNAKKQQKNKKKHINKFNMLHFLCKNRHFLRLREKFRGLFLYVETGEMFVESEILQKTNKNMALSR
jgi:hypothetical protein